MLRFVDEGKDVASRLKNLAGNGFICTANYLCRAIFLFDNNRGISHPWYKQNVSASVDLFTGFMKRNDDVALRKPEGLSSSRAQGI
jgi:hypothetical protein